MPTRVNMDLLPALLYEKVMELYHKYDAIIFGKGTPANSVGKPGQFYHDRDTGFLWARDGTGWLEMKNVLPNQQSCHASAWIASYCKKCSYPVMITQPKKPGADYWWYCANKACKMHHPGEQLGDMDDWPKWVEERDSPRSMR